ECAAESRGGGVYERHGLGYGNGLCLLAGLQAEGDPDLLAHLQHNILACQRLETFGLSTDRVAAREERRSVILPSIVSGQGARNAALRVGDRYAGISHRAAALISNGSENTAKIGL